MMGQYQCITQGYKGCQEFPVVCGYHKSNSLLHSKHTAELLASVPYLHEIKFLAFNSLSPTSDKGKLKFSH